MNDFEKYLQSDLVNLIKPRDDVVEYLRKLKILNHEIYIITGRKLTEMRDTYNETLNGFKINNIPLTNLL